MKIFPSTHAFRSIIFSEKTAVISNKNSHYTGIAEDMVKIPSKPKFLPGFLPVVQWRQHPTGGESHMFHSRRGLRFFFLCSTLVTTENYICLMIFYIVNLFINMLNIGWIKQDTKFWRTHQSKLARTLSKTKMYLWHANASDDLNSLFPRIYPKTQIFCLALNYTHNTKKAGPLSVQT